jgi:hypothetical protein
MVVLGAALCFVLWAPVANRLLSPDFCLKITGILFALELQAQVCAAGTSMVVVREPSQQMVFFSRQHLFALPGDPSNGSSFSAAPTWLFSRMTGTLFCPATAGARVCCWWIEGGLFGSCLSRCFL